VNSAIDTLHVAAIQLNAGSDKVANLAQAGELVAEAAAFGSQLIVLPELFNRYGDLTAVAAEAETLEGATVARMKAWAEQHKVWLVGSLACRASSDSEKPFNLAVVVDPSGRVQATYAKIHLFDIDLPERVTSRESNSIAAGTDVTCTQIGWAQTGLGICYDLRFPELFRRLADRGAQLLIVPSAFTSTTGKDHWELLVRARAVENQAFVVAANQVGPHQPSGESFGHSMIVDPWGNVLAAANGIDRGVIHVNIHRKRLEEVRSQLPAMTNRRLSS
jgi:predicted amidohydrolase